MELSVSGCSAPRRCALQVKHFPMHPDRLVGPAGL